MDASSCTKPPPSTKERWAANNKESHRRKKSACEGRPHRCRGCINPTRPWYAAAHFIYQLATSAHCLHQQEAWLNTAKQPANVSSPRCTARRRERSRAAQGGK